MRLGIVILATTLACAGSIKIAQCNIPKSVSVVVILKRSFDHELRPAIRIYRPLWMPLIDRYVLGYSVCRASGGKNEFLYSVVHQNVQEMEGLDKVVFVILSRLCNRFTNVSVSRKMHARLNAMTVQN